MQLTQPQLEHLFEIWPIARFASIAENHTPHLVPIVFVAVDGVIYSPIDGKPKRGDPLQRLRNVARNPAASLLLDRYDADWRALWWLRVDVRADVIAQDIASFDRIVAALIAKYPQYGSVPVFVGTPTILRMTPVRHTAWSARPLDWGGVAAGNS